MVITARPEDRSIVDLEQVFIHSSVKKKNHPACALAVGRVQATTRR